MNNKNCKLFYFETSDLTYILGKHDFYVSEAKKRIFDQFSESNIEVEARQKEQDDYDDAGRRFNPYYDDEDEGFIVERAYDEGNSYWQDLNKMKNIVSLALTAGMFHQFDKQLREKCIFEFGHWLDREVVASMIWNISIHKLIEMLEWIGMDIFKSDYYEKIDICQTVVNVYKHGDGPANKTLSNNHPEYYKDSWFSKSDKSILDHERLEVTEAQFIEFADAITAFWKNIPTNCRFSDIREEPKWISKEIKKHKKKTKKL